MSDPCGGLSSNSSGSHLRSPDLDTFRVALIFAEVFPRSDRSCTPTIVPLGVLLKLHRPETKQRWNPTSQSSASCLNKTVWPPAEFNIELFP